ncbi:hypothetical protein T439DRAFT_378754 [Meredithblackwellia eburnea MCA 4105]
MDGFSISRGQRRLSRITPSQFDSMLSSNQTVIVQHAGRDESTLGKTPKKQPSSSTTTHNHQSPSTPSAKQSSSNPASTTIRGADQEDDDEEDLNNSSPELSYSRKHSAASTNQDRDHSPIQDPERRSLYRSVGTASSPDLVSLVRKAKEATPKPTPNEETVALSSPLSQSGSFTTIRSNSRDNDDSSSTTRTPVASIHTSSSPTRTRSRPTPSHPESPPVPRSSSTRSDATLDIPFASPSTSSTSSMDPSPRKGRLSDISIMSTASYVHVNSPQKVSSSSTASNYSSSSAVPSASTSSPQRQMASQANGSRVDLDSSARRVRANSSTRPEEEQRSSTFSNTMRKTSRFFRKLGGGGGNPTSPQPARTSTFGGTLSAPVTPTSGVFSQNEVAPPVPPVPSKPAAANSSSPSSSPTMTTHSRKPSIDILIQKTPPKPVLARDGSSNTLHVSSPGGSVGGGSSGNSRRRSLSLGAAAAAAAALGGPPSSPGERKKGTEETEKLRSELQQWKLDVDGVLGSIDDSVPKLDPAAGGAPPSFAPLGVPLSSRPERPVSSPPTGMKPPFLPGISLDNRRPTWDANWAKEHPESATPTPNPAAAEQGKHSSTPSSPPLPLKTSRSGSASSEKDKTLAARLATPVFPSPLVDPFGSGSYTDTPSIRLVSPAVSASDHTDEVEPLVLNSDGKSEGLGIGLETIKEGSHSREGSAANTPSLSQTSDGTPTATPAGSPDLSGGSSSQQGPGSLPLLFAQGPSPSSGLSRKQIARQSVVAYPARPPVSTTVSTSTSKSGSMSSLHSDTAINLRRTRSGTGSGGEEDSSKTDSPGASLDERATSFAQKCWDEDPNFLERKKIAEWLGSTGRLNVAALRKYMDFFNFTGLRLDAAFRRLCEKLYLKAETQQVDRILEQFSRRYWENNPRSVYGAADVVHAVAYSLLLLNTDLHVVDSTTRMSRQQFVRNTVAAINEQTGDDVPTSTGLLFGANNTTSDDLDSSSVFGGNEEASASRKSLDKTLSKAMSRRSSSVNSWKNIKDSTSSTPVNQGSPIRARGTASLDGSPVRDLRGGTFRSASFDTELETTLKDMYTAIKAQPIFQPQSSSTHLTSENSRSSVSLTPGGSPYGSWGGVNRSGSRRSAASTMSSSSVAYKRSSVRGFGSFLGTSSVELLRSSSPTPSTATSISDDNYSTAYGAASHHQIPTMGFANSLSNTIIREQQEDDAKSDGEVSITDEELALLGAPWAKEGLVFRKHYWESKGKRSKDKHWLQVFVVISQGELRMFRFDTQGTAKGGRPGMGGGDWASNAQTVGEISLAHALCSAMPPPGYSRDRPHCFVLTLPGGGSYFFQAGTPDLVAEWVATCNYWAARLSKEPLTGGVSNMEYGWNRVIPSQDNDDFEEIASIRSGKSGRSGVSKISYQGSVAPSMLNGNDRIGINDWTPPTVPLGASILGEEGQLDSLKRHVGVVRAELTQHNVLRAPMTKLYSSRSLNLAKASANWERKSQHLLSEIVKYQTYIDQLERSIRLRALRRGQKEVENMLEAADDVDSPLDEEAPALEADAEPDPQNIERMSTDTPEKGRRRLAGISSTSSTGESHDEYYDVAQTPSQSSPV